MVDENFSTSIDEAIKRSNGDQERRKGEQTSFEGLETDTTVPSVTQFDLVILVGCALAVRTVSSHWHRVERPWPRIGIRPQLTGFFVDRDSLFLWKS